MALAYWLFALLLAICFSVLMACHYELKTAAPDGKSSNK